MSRLEWAFWSILAAMILVDVWILLLNMRRRTCQRCYRGWAIFNRRTMRVCKMCRDDIDKKPPRSMTRAGLASA